MNFASLQRPPVFWSCAIGLACLHIVLASSAMRHKSTTSDELAHITAGAAYWAYNDYRFQPENGNFPQRVHGLAALAVGGAPPNPPPVYWAESDVWLAGYNYFYQDGPNPEPRLWWARTANSLFGGILVLLVTGWSARLFGAGAGLFSGGLTALSPTVLAHSAMATSDMAMAVAFLACVAAWWRFLGRPSKATLALSAGLAGLAALAKFSAVLIAPMAALLLLWRWWLQPTAGRARWLGWVALGSLVHIGVVVLFVWAAFGFRYHAFAPDAPAGDFSLSWDFILAYGGSLQRVILLMRDTHLLPEAYLYGFAFVLKHAVARGAFLNGDYSIFGWWYFFPYTLWAKTPLTLFGLLGMGGLTVAARLRASRKSIMAALGDHLTRIAPLVVLLGVYWAFSLTSHLNIGHRHILPTYGPMFILAGAACLGIGRSALRAASVGALALGFIASSWLIRPHYLAYFNQAVGGPTQGWRHLVDSSLDWGQDLPALADWLAENRRPGEPVFLSYFGTGEPDVYGIQATRMPMIHHFDRVNPWYWLEPGIYAISASMLQHVYMPIRGPWTVELEREYQELRAIEPRFREYAENHANLTREVSPEQWQKAWRRFEQLRFARLCHYLRARGPDAEAGYSILLFHLSADELDIAVNGSLRELADGVAAQLIK